MASLLESLKLSIQSLSPIDYSEPKQYQLFVCDQLLSLSRSYSALFEKALERWLEQLHSSIMGAVSLSHSNQIKPKLQLIYTSAMNSSDKVRQHISQLNIILSQGNFCFDHQWNQLTQTKPRTMSKTKGFGLENTVQSQFIRPNRSLSSGVRRKLSKTNCFAQARKIEPVMQVMKPTKIKKTKKRQEKGFQGLQNYLSSTSPSNFMMQYLTQQPKPQQPSHRYVEHLKESMARSRLRQQPQIVVNVPRERRGSDQYQKTMNNFQQKISSKLDQIMEKYTQIENRLSKEQQNINPITNPISQVSNPIVTIPTSSPQKADSPQKNRNTVQNKNQRNNFDFRNVSHNVSQYQDVPRGSMIENEKSKVNSTKATQKQNKTSAVRLMSKVVHGKNKIVRNRTQQSAPADQEVEVLTLGTKEVEKVASRAKQQLGLKGKQQQERNKKQEQKYFIEQLIEEFRQMTEKVILTAVTGKLLFVLKNTYISFCKNHRLNPSNKVVQIHTQPMSNVTAEMTENLQKMKKIVTLNCPQEKKDKMLQYVDVFLNSFLRFNADSVMRDKPGGSIEEKINLAMKRVQG